MSCRRLREAIKHMPEFANIEGDVCFRDPAGRKQAVLIQSYQPLSITDRRRQIEDLCRCVRTEGPPYSRSIQMLCYRDLVINNDHISRMERTLREAIGRGLSKKTHAEATVKCFPTYVRELPSGTERGKFLALDLGGTNFRVVLIEIEGHEK